VYLIMHSTKEQPTILKSQSYATALPTKAANQSGTFFATPSKQNAYLESTSKKRQAN
jgi:hypothetical protein